MAEMSMVEKVARAIDPIPFKSFNGLRDYCLQTGDDEAAAARTAEWAHGHEVRCVMQKARAAIEAMREPTEKQLDAVRYLVQWHTFERPTEAALLRHAGCLRKPAPEGCRDVEHVPPTNMVSYWIHRGIIDAALSEEVAG